MQAEHNQKTPGPFMLWKEQGRCSGESACLPSIWPRFDSNPVPRVEFAVGCHPAQRVFVLVLLFPPSTKTNISKFQFNHSTIMHKSFRTNLHFWRFCAHARQKYNFTCLTSSPTPIQCWKATCTACNFFWFSTLYWMGRNSNAFLKGKQHFFQTSWVLTHIQFVKSNAV